MKKLVILFLALFTVAFVQAQDNVADVAHTFIKAVKMNDMQLIKDKFLTAGAAYALLPKESAGLSEAQKNEQFITPLYNRFAENFEKIQAQIKSEQIDPRKIDLVSYKLEKIDPAAEEAQQKKILPQAMSLFFNYHKKEQNIPISVIEIDEKWYILEILFTTDIFK